MDRIYMLIISIVISIIWIMILIANNTIVYAISGSAVVAYILMCLINYDDE